MRLGITLVYVVYLISIIGQSAAVALPQRDFSTPSAIAARDSLGAASIPDIEVRSPSGYINHFEKRGLFDFLFSGIKVCLEHPPASSRN
jgi:hypothetical protein